MRVKMLFDISKSSLWSGNVYDLSEQRARQLIGLKKAVEYNISTCKKVVNVDGKEMTWGDYLRRKRIV